MDIINRRLNLDEFEDYVRTYNFGTKPANKLVIHHTWRPTAASWSGQRSVDGLKRYYEGKGWPAGPHLFIAEDGSWLFTPMRRNGIHASQLNPRSIGIEVVGDYDTRKWEGKTKTNALGVIKILMQHLNLAEKDIFFHRDVSPKSCPGWAITKKWLFEELRNFRRIPNHSQPVSVTSPSELPGELFIPPWAVEGVAFVEQHKLFEIRTHEDVREAVKFHRFYKLIKHES